jgi:peptidyl-prolyl cis-trans isomerase A (cyclophilin A)
MSVRILAVVFGFLLLVGCAETEEQHAAPQKIEQAPAIYRVRFETSQGAFVVEVTRDWAPRGADRFHELVRNHFYDGCRFFRVVPNFVAQFGINRDPSISRLWSQLGIPDDPVAQSNKKGAVSYAKSGPATRTTQVFINLSDNTRLDAMGFAPFGRVTSDMDVVESLYKGYGEMAPRGNGPNHNRIEMEGYEYLKRHFPRLDYIQTATLVEP